MKTETLTTIAKTKEKLLKYALVASRNSDSSNADVSFPSSNSPPSEDEAGANVEAIASMTGARVGDGPNPYDEELK